MFLPVTNFISSDKLLIHVMISFHEYFGKLLKSIMTCSYKNFTKTTKVVEIAIKFHSRFVQASIKSEYQLAKINNTHLTYFCFI